MSEHLEHSEVRELVAGRRGARLEGTVRAAVETHLAACPECARVAAAERGLDELLGRLPRHQAPAELVRRLEQRWLGAPGDASGDPMAAANLAALPRAGRETGASSASVSWPPPAWPAPAPAPASAGSPSPSLPPLAPRPSRRAQLAAGSVFLAAVIAAIFLWAWHGPRSGALAAAPPLVREAVNDHLRALVATHPADVESSDTHQVKPWLTGHLDFAPVVAFGGDDRFPLVGGAVGYFHDRKCAELFFRRRLHAITLLVLPRAGLDWPARTATRDRGFNVVLWHKDDLAYALVSDVDPAELDELAARVSAPPARSE
jgi:anti-sigma factor RsiW